ncbi:GNAT family N-acetyltransferase [Roseateles sp. L2-2]|uniref:GNAT family N-acetyltransferase n=1 Tax=Roseateles sp. L2-2 TaxID=3422597 RepID=UPI003D36813E
MPLDPLLREVASELKTDRMLLRTPRAGDGALVHEAVVETLAALRAWPASLPWAVFEPSVEASEMYCRESAAAFVKRSSLVYLAFDAEDALVASLSLHSIDWTIPKFELGFWCRTSRQRQGLMAEAASELKRYAFDRLGARRVEAFPDEANVGSRAVCEAIGMQFEGTLRNDRITPDGVSRSTSVYASVRA